MACFSQRFMNFSPRSRGITVEAPLPCRRLEVCGVKKGKSRGCFPTLLEIPGKLLQKSASWFYEFGISKRVRNETESICFIYRSRAQLPSYYTKQFISMSLRSRLSLYALLGIRRKLDEAASSALEWIWWKLKTICKKCFWLISSIGVFRAHSTKQSKSGYWHRRRSTCSRRSQSRAALLKPFETWEKEGKWWLACCKHTTHSPKPR